MSLPTISTAGTAGGLLLITDRDGVVNRVPKASVSNVTDSSNSDVFRLEVSHSRGVIVLLFTDAAEVATAMADIDAQY